MADETKRIQAFVAGRIAALRDAGNEAAVRARLAALRRGVGKAPGSLPELWGETLEGLPEEFYSRDGTPTRAEWAVYTALTLFALHQQGKEVKVHLMSAEGVSLGMAVRRLIRSDEDEARVKRRFDAAVTASSVAEFTHHLRGLVQLLKADEIPLDYPALAADLYLFQLERARDGVRLRWGQDFYRRPAADAPEAAEA